MHLEEPDNIFTREKYDLWYRLNNVRKSLAEYQLRYREGAVLGDSVRVRNMAIKEISHMDENIRRFGLDKEIVNWYYSIAIVKMPIFSFDLQKRYKQGDAFTKDFEMFIRGYDLALDFDSKECSADTAYKDMKRVHDWMVENNIIHTVRCSGSGFHILVYSRYLWNSPFHFKAGLSHKLCRTIARYIKDDFGLESLDTGVYGIRQIWKCPYSMDFKTGNICRPLNEKEIRHFNWKLVNPVYCARNKSEIFFNRKVFDGTVNALHKYIYNIFDSTCKNVRGIWKMHEDDEEVYPNKLNRLVV